jgi:uncharacterized protein YwbE
VHLTRAIINLALQLEIVMKLDERTQLDRSTVVRPRAALMAVPHCVEVILAQ